MIQVSQNGAVLTLSYRPLTLGIVGGALLVLGAAFLLLAVHRPHDVTLQCAGASCELRKVAVMGEERVAVIGLRGVDSGRELVLHTDGGELVMGPSTGRRNTGSYQLAAQEIRTYLERGATGELVTTVPVRATLRFFGFGGLFVVFGLALVLVFAIGTKTTIDKRDDLVVRWRSRHRVRVSDLTEIVVRNNAIVGKLRVGGELALLATLGGLKRASSPTTRPELEEVAARIRSFVGV